MRGKTAKKLKKFVKVIMENTNEEQRGTKTEIQIYEEMKELWRTQGQRGQKFVDFIINGTYK